MEIQILLIVALINIISIYASAYLTQKGKNKAQSQDIQNLTKKVESVKIEFSEKLSNINQQISKEINIHNSLSHLEIEATIQWYKDFFAWSEFLQNGITISHIETIEQMKDFYNPLRERISNLLYQEKKSFGLLRIFINSKNNVANLIVNLRAEYLELANKLNELIFNLQKIDMDYIHAESATKDFKKYDAEKNKMGIEYYDSASSNLKAHLAQNLVNIEIELLNNLKSLTKTQ